MADFINTIDALGDDAVVDSIINRTITEFKDDKLTYLGDSAFYDCTQLKEVDLPNALYLHASVFRGCTSLETVNLPELIGLATNRYDNHWFGGCTSLRSITLPKVTVVGQQYAFSGCTSLEYVDLPMATKIPIMCFDNCRALKALILRRTDGIATLVNTNAIPQSAPVYIYVPAALIDSYKAAANWSTYADQFRKLEEWTVDGTVTGALDIENRHMVRFFNSDGTLLGYQIVATGGSASYTDTPVCPDNADAPFKGFVPSPTNVTADMDCYAKFALGFEETDFTMGYSVEWDYTQSATTLTRIGLSSEFSNPTPATSLTDAGSSPFDNILPWSGMKRYNIIDGSIAYSEDDAGFSMTDYDTVVYIPPFYYAAYKDEANSKWRWSISPTEKDGYELHPGSGRYIGRYHSSGSSTTLFSKSGVQPRVSLSRANFRTYSHQKGENWWMIDIATWSALQLLFLVEFADFNSQQLLGKGSGSESQALGSTDAAVYHTYNGGDTTNQYRWIEHPWGRCYDWVDGCVASARACYLSTNNSTFSDAITKLDAADVTMPSPGSITGFGYSNKFPWAFLPDAASGGSTSSYVPDNVNNNSDTGVLYVGGNSGTGDFCGLFYFSTYSKPSAAPSSYTGSRLIYIP